MAHRLVAALAATLVGAVVAYLCMEAATDTYMLNGNVVMPIWVVILVLFACGATASLLTHVFERWLRVAHADEVGELRDRLGELERRVAEGGRRSA